jgi:hypothetical protein
MARTTVPGVFRTLQRWLIGIFTYSFVGSAVLRGTTLPGQVSHQQLRSRLVDHRHWTRVCSSAQRPGNVLRLWMNWILREMLALFVLHFIESGTQGERLRCFRSCINFPLAKHCCLPIGYPTSYEWARSYVKEHLTYLCSLNQPHVRHITTDYCRWTIWCINNLYDSGRRPMIFRSLQSIFRAFEDAYFMSDTTLAMIPTPTQERE